MCVRAQGMYDGRMMRELEKADITRGSSQAVPHPSTNRALCCLTSEVRRDRVHSIRYGRQRSNTRAARAADYKA